jgi:hypothetical protein
MFGHSIVLTGARASATADSGKTRHVNQAATQASHTTHTYAEGGRLEPRVIQLVPQ